MYNFIFYKTMNSPDTNFELCAGILDIRIKADIWKYIFSIKGGLK